MTKRLRKLPIVEVLNRIKIRIVEAL